MTLDGSSLRGRSTAATSAPQRRSWAVGMAPKTSPAVRSLLSEHDLNAVDIPDANEDGRITKEDVIDYLEKKQKIRPAESSACCRARRNACPSLRDRLMRYHSNSTPKWRFRPL